MLVIITLARPIEAANFDRERSNSRVAFMLKSWKKNVETGLKTNQLKKAKKNFCLINDIKLRGSQMKYFSMKCEEASDEYIFLGFTDGKLGKDKIFCLKYSLKELN